MPKDKKLHIYAGLSLALTVGLFILKRTKTMKAVIDDLYLDWTEKELPQAERTKHVHGMHPYLGKFIPQLPEIFLERR